MYHASSLVEGRLRHLGVPAAVLREQLAALHERGYRLVGLTEALSLHATAPSVAVTFDDAYGDFLYAALPILEELDARATIYVPTGHVGGQARWLGDEASALPPLLTWEELRRCHASGRVEIGSHTISHRELDILRGEALRRELEDSKEHLERRLGITVSSLCYPHGYHSRSVRAAVQAAGYSNACEVGRRLRAPVHRWAVSRLAVGPDLDGAAVVDQVRRGGPRLAPAVKRVLRPPWRLVRAARAAWTP